MAKVSFSKLGLKINNDIKTVIINEQEVTVKQYLPVEDKLNLIANVLNKSADDNNFSNPVKLEIFGALEVISFYTNINFTEKQKENPAKLYDMLESNGIINKIVEVIPRSEYRTIIDGINECSEAFYKYQNSILGILEAVASDYSQLDLDATNIQQKIADPNNMELLKAVVEKLG